MRSREDKRLEVIEWIKVALLMAILVGVWL